MANHPIPHLSAARLGVCSWSLRPLSSEALATMMKRLGLDACQLALVPLVEEADVWSEGVQVLREQGIAVVSGMMAMKGEDYTTLDSIRRTGGVALDEHWAYNLNMAARVADVAAEANIPLVTFHAGFLPHRADDPERALMLERLRLIARRFAARSIRVAFETGQENAQTLLGVLEELAMPSVGVNFDPANMILYDMGDPIDAVRRLAPHILQVHIKDALPSRQAGEWGEEVVIGQGAVDWAAFFEMVRSLPRRVNYMIEREAGDSRETDIATAAAIVRHHLDPPS